MAALRSRCGHSILPLWFLSIFLLFSSSILSSRRLDVYHSQTLQDVWPSPGLVHYIYILPPNGICHVQNSLCVQVLRSPILAALLHCTPAAGLSHTLRRGTRNGIKELSQRAPPYSAGRSSRWASAHIRVQKLVSGHAYTHRTNCSTWTTSGR